MVVRLLADLRRRNNGDVTGPASAVAGDVAGYADTTGKALKVLDCINLGTPVAATTGRIHAQYLRAYGDGTPADFINATWGPTYWPKFTGLRRRGTYALPLPLLDGDVICGMYAGSYDTGGTLRYSASLTMEADGAPTGNTAPGSVSFFAGGELRFRLRASGAVEVPGLTASSLVATNADKALVSLDPATYAVAAKGVTNGDSHDHAGGDGALVPLAGMAHIASGVVLGRASAGSGIPEALPTVSSGSVVLANALHSLGVGTLVERFRTMFGSNLVGLWAGRSLSGTTLTDLSGNGRNGTYGSGPTSWVEEGAARCAVAGVEHYWDAGDADAFSVGDGVTDRAMSWVACFKPTGVSTDLRPILSKYNSPDGLRELLWRCNATEISLRLYDQSSGGYIGQRTTTATVTTDTWNVFGASYAAGGTGSAGIVLYQNGAALTTTAYQSGSYTAVENTTAPLGCVEVIAGPTTRVQPGVHGVWACVNRVITADEFAALQPLLLGYVGAL